MTVCLAEGCDRTDHHARGLCNVHYIRARRNPRQSHVSRAVLAAERFAALREDVQWLTDAGHTRDDIAARVGIKWASIARAYNRRGLPVPSVSERRAA